MLDAVVDYLPSPLDIPPVKGVEPGNDCAGGAAGEGRRAVFGPCLQNHDRPVRRHVDVFPRLLRLDQFRRRASTTRRAANVSESAACSRCTRTSARRSRKSTPATSPPPSASKPQPPAIRCATKTSRSCWNPSISRSGHLHRNRAQEQGRPRKARLVAAEARHRGSVVQSPHRRRNRPNDHLRHGGAASGNHRRSLAPRVQRRRQRRQAPGRL